MQHQRMYNFSDIIPLSEFYEMYHWLVAGGGVVT
jgi:hypothetical protein